MELREHTDPPELSEDLDLLHALLDSLKDSVCFVDTTHTIRYMNAPSAELYKKFGGMKLLGTSLLDCHNEQQQEQIREVFAALQAGEEERLITDDAEHRIFMRAVRDRQGRLIGYTERYEPPAAR